MEVLPVGTAINLIKLIVVRVVPIGTVTKLLRLMSIEVVPVGLPLNYQY